MLPALVNHQLPMDIFQDRGIAGRIRQREVDRPFGSVGGFGRYDSNFFLLQFGDRFVDGRK